MKPITRVIAVAAGGMLSLSLASCAGNGGSGTTLRIAEIGSATVDKALMHASGQDQGMSYKLQYSLFDAGPSALEAGAGGSIDMGVIGDSPMVFAQAGGTTTKIVGVARSTAAGVSNGEIVVPKGSSITKVADLKGKKLGVTPDTIMQFESLKMLQAAGLSPKDVTMANLSPVDASTALTGGRVDAATLIQPQTGQQVAAGGKVIGTSASLVQDRVVVVATKQALADPTKTRDIKDYLQRYQRAQNWARTHPTAWAKVYAQTTGLDVATARTVVDSTRFVLEPINAKQIAQQQDEADTFHQLGLLDKKLNVSSEFDDRFNPVVATLPRAGG